MFSAKTFDFLIENRLMNSREWFREHRGDYDEYVLKPLVELSESLGGFISSIDDRIVTAPKINKTISRVYRDTRFSKDKSLFRDWVWLSFKRDKKAFPHYPEFFVVLSPTDMTCGCGYYYAKPETVLAIREMIIGNDEAFAKALEAYRKQDVFTLDGERLKRSKYSDCPDYLKDWLDLKNISVVNRTDDFSLVFSDSLADVLKSRLILVRDVYSFFLKAEMKASGLIE